MRYMKSDIYFMTLALLSVWKVGVLKNYMGIVVCNANDDLIKIQCMKKDEYKNDACMAAVFFGQNIQFGNAKIFTTFCPTYEFMSCAVSKKIQNVIYLAKNNNSELEKEFNICQRFPHNFGKIIDLLSLYNK